MRRRVWIVGSVSLVVVVVLALAGIGLTHLTAEQEQPLSTATSPDGSWSVSVVGKRRLSGAYELVVKVRDARGQETPGGSFVVGLTRDLAAAERDQAVSFIDNATAKVGSRTLEKAKFIRE
jgi:hypothetical protein